MYIFGFPGVVLSILSDSEAKHLLFGGQPMVETLPTVIMYCHVDPIWSTSILRMVILRQLPRWGCYQSLQSYCVWCFRGLHSAPCHPADPFLSARAETQWPMVLAPHCRRFQADFGGATSHRESPGTGDTIYIHMSSTTFSHLYFHVMKMDHKHWIIGPFQQWLRDVENRNQQKTGLLRFSSLDNGSSEVCWWIS